jgi:hypothetical protein
MMTMEDERFVIELAMEIQADIFADLAAGFALTERGCAFHMVHSLEEAVARELTTRATKFQERGLSARSIGQVAGFLAGTFEAAREKMVSVTQPH